MKRLLTIFSLLGLMLVAGLPKASATHVAGGEIKWECIGGSQFIITMDLYEDCGGSATLPNSEVIGIRSSCATNTIQATLPMVLNTEISQICAAQIVQSECNGGTLPGINLKRYQDTITLGAPCNFYTIFYRRQNRNTSVNVPVSIGSAFYVEAEINTVANACDDSPTFSSTPIPYYCTSQTVNYNYAAIDPEGDSLVYSFDTVQGFVPNGITTGNPVPLAYAVGFNALNPMTGITLNGTTGEVNFTPSATSGNYIVKMRVDTYDTLGVWKGAIFRDMQNVVESCTNNIPSAPLTLIGTTGNSQVTGPLQITADIGENFCTTVQFTDPNLGDNVTLTSNVTTVLTGATETITNGNPSSSSFCWTVPLTQAPGTYNVAFSVVDDACPISGSNSINVEVIVPTPPALGVVVTSNDVSCNGLCDGDININVTNGSGGPYTFAWSGTGTGQGTANYTNLCPGSYSVFIQDPGNGTDTLVSGITISEPAPLFFASSSFTEISCHGDCDGTATGNVVGGTTPLTFLWDDPAVQTTNVATGLCGGTYELLVTDANGCTTNRFFTIVEPPAIIGQVDSSTNVSCNGGNDGEATISGHGGSGASTSTAEYIIDQTGPFAPYGTGLSTATSIVLGDDAVSASQPIGFTFEFFGVAQTNFFISSNGFIGFSAGTPNGCCTGQSIPTAGGPNNFIAAAWEDLNPTLGGAIDYYTAGVSPNRILVVNYTGVPHHPGGNAVTAQIVLFETSNIIQIHTTNMPSDGQNHTMGIENATGTEGLAVPGRNAANWSATNDFVSFIPSTQAFTYAWPGGGVNQTQTGLTAGTYCVTITDVGGCSDTACVVISEPTPLAATLTNTPPSCNGSNDGTATATASGGTPSYTFAWSNSGTTATINGLTAGTYTVTVTDANGCTTSASTILTEPTAVVASATSTNVNCNGDNDGTATASGSGGTPGYTFLWSTAATSASITGLAPGTYSVTVTDAGSCTDSTSIVITEPTVLSSSASTVTNVTCFGGNDGSATSAGAGGTTPYSFLWSNSSTSTSPSGLTAGTYTVTVTDANGCTDTSQVTVSEPPTGVTAAILTSTNVSCNGGNDGTAAAAASGGSPGYTFLWTTTSTASAVSGLTAGTYTVTVTDANGCTDTEQVVITEPAPINITIASNDASCNGGADGDATATPTGGTSPYTFLWSTAATSAGINALTVGTYTVTVTDANGCTNSQSVVIGEPTLLAANTSIDAPISCNGASDGGVSASGSGGTPGYTFLWSNASTNSSLTGVSAGTYSVTITDANGCTVTGAATLGNPPAVVAGITVTNVNCNGGADGTATASGAGGTPGYTFLWSTAATTATINGLTAGTYTVTVTDANGCTDTSQVTVSEPPTGVTAAILTSTNVTCNGGNDGTAAAAAAGGSPGYTFLWTTTSTASAVSGLTAGTYTVTATDANGCTDTEQVVITEPTPINITIASNDASCNGGADGDATATPTGGTSPYTFLWSNAATTAGINGLTAGTYTVTVTDANGCTNTQSEIITEPTLLAANTSIDAPISCNGAGDGGVSASGSGGTPGYTFLWSNASTNSSLTGVPAGTYTVTITDANGCTVTGAATLGDPPAVVAGITVTNVNCNGGADGTATASGAGGTPGYTFLWSTAATTATINGLAAGTYSVTVTDANGCTASTSATITAPSAPVSASILASTNVTCNGGNDGTASAAASGGTPIYSFLWSNASTAPGISGLIAGTYTVTITDANGCSDTAQAIISEPAAVDPVVTFTNVSCNGGNDGTATSTPTGGNAPYTFLWSTASTSNTISGLTAGTYTVTVSDANGCTGSGSATITVPNPVIASINGTNLSCNGASDGSATASGSGGTPGYTFLWNTAATGATINSLPAGTYSVTVTDASGCTDSTSVTLTQPTTVIVVAGVVNQVTCGGGNDGSASAAAAGGTLPYSFLWSTNGTAPIITGLIAGTYTVTVTDGSGCTGTDQVTITEPTAVVATATLGNNVSCNSFTDGDVCASAIGGAGGYTFSWNTGATSACISGLGAGTYCVTVTDLNGCTDSACVTVTEPTPLVSFAVVDSNTSCAGSTGGATASATGGTTPYSFLWSTAATTSFITGVGAGTYSVTVTDANGCTDSSSVTIIQLANTVVASAVTNTNVSCFGGSDGVATASATGGTPGYTFLWSTTATTATINGLTAGTYSVTITDAGGCTDTTSTVVTEPTLMVASATLGNNVSCNGGADGTATAAGAGGTPGYTFFWNTTATTPTASGLTAGTFSVTVTDANGCTDSASVTITEPTVLAASATSTDVTTCGGNDGTATASGTGGTPGYTFLWSNAGTSAGITNLVAGTYTVTVTDANGCTDTTSVNISNPPNSTVANILTSTNVSCNGLSDGAITAGGSGGTGTYTFIWSNAATSATISSLSAGTYSVTVTDGNSCTDSASVTITEPTIFVASATVDANTACAAPTGQATASGTGGTTPYSFLWSTSSTNATISGIGAGQYCVTITDANGCSDTACVNITQIGNTVVATAVVDSNTSCASPTGGATVTGGGGTAPYTFLWSNSVTNSFITGVGAGIYSVTVTDVNGCTDSASVSIIQLANTVVAAAVVDSNATCNGLANGGATASATGGTAPFTFLWSNAAITASITGVPAGTYTVTVTDAGSCTDTISVIITEPTAIIASAAVNSNVNCLGGNDGSATASATGGTPGYTFIWPNGSSSATVTNLTAGTHCVTITDANGCTDIACVNITEPLTGVIASIVSSTNVTCNGGSDGSATASATGGLTPYVFLWPGGTVNATVNSLPAGTYCVTVTDAGGCTDTACVIISEPPVLVASIMSFTNPSCPGDLDGTAIVAGSGGTGPYTFLWPSANTAATETGLGAGTYCVTVTDANLCTDTACVIITDPPAISNTFTLVSDANCGVCDGKATANPTGGGGGPYTFLWSNGVTAALDTTLCAGLNDVTITDANGCTAVFVIPTSSIGADTATLSSTPTSCPGVCDGSVIATYTCTSPTCTVNWVSISSGLSVGTTDTVTGLCAGQYFLELTNGLGCVDIDTVTITGPAPIVANETFTNASCGGTCDGTATVNPTGGTSPYTFIWPSSGTANTETGLCAGTYTVTISDANGCDTTATVTIIEPAAITVIPTATNPSCNGVCDGTISVSPSGGTGPYTFLWSPTPASGQNTSVAGGLCAGLWVVTVTDANGCTGVDSTTLTEPPAIVIDTAIVTNATCGLCDGSVALTVSGGAGGYTFLWSNTQTGNTATALCAGLYGVTVTDASGCTAEFPIPVSNVGGPTIALSTNDASCGGVCDGTAAVSIVAGTGPFTYLWLPGLQTTDSISNLCAGIYGVAVTDGSGCVTVDTATIIEPPALNLNFTTSLITCAGGGCDGSIIVTPAGVIGPFTYLWSNADTTDSIGGLCSGTYTVTVTAASGCTAIDSVTLVDPAPFLLTLGVVDASCNSVCDGQLALFVGGAGGTPPYSYLWSNGDTTDNVTGLCAGAYVVTVTDAAGCSDTATATINEPTAIVTTITNITTPGCGLSDGDATINSTGGTPATVGQAYTYMWLDAAFVPLAPAQTTVTASGLSAGIYNVIVTDSIGCADTTVVIVNNTDAPVIALDSINHVSCFGACDGEIFVSVTSINPPVAYLWSNGDTIEDPTGLCAGSDTLTTTDALGCLAFDIYEVLEPAELFVTYTVTDVNCGNDCDGIIVAHATGGTGPYTYLWDNAETDSTIIDLCAGDYILTLTDANGCSIVDTVSVQGPSPIVITVDALVDASCNTINDGEISITVTGGSAPYTYAWNGPGGALNVEDLTNILSGVYTLTITDTGGCSIDTTFTVGSDAFVSVLAMPDISICPTDSFLVTSTSIGATALQWLDTNGALLGNDSSVFVNPVIGVNKYVIIASDSLCIFRDTVIVTVLPGPGVNAGADQSITFGSSVVIGGNPTGPSGAAVAWSPATGLNGTTVSNPIASPAVSTTYTVTIVDGDGCFGVDEVFVEVVPIAVPVTGFSPNGDGINEGWVIDFIEDYPNAEVEIYNRWGQLLFRSVGYNTPWDGQYKGEKLPIGTYYYVIDLKDPNIKEPVTGPVTILR